MYRAGIEWILGFRLRGARLHIDPCIPRSWPRFEITFRYHSSRYNIIVDNPRGATRGVLSISLDGKPPPSGGATILLVDDRMTHHVRIVLGEEISCTPRRA